MTGPILCNHSHCLQKAAFLVFFGVSLQGLIYLSLGKGPSLKLCICKWGNRNFYLVEVGLKNVFVIIILTTYAVRAWDGALESLQGISIP